MMHEQLTDRDKIQMQASPSQKTADKGQPSPQTSPTSKHHKPAIRNYDQTGPDIAKSMSTET